VGVSPSHAEIPGSNSTEEHGILTLVSVVCVLSSTGIYVELIPRQKESYGLWCVSLIVKPQHSEGHGTL